MVTHKRFKVKILIIQLISIIPFLLFIFYLFDLWFDTRRAMVIEQNTTQAKLVGEYLQNAFNYGMTVSSILSNDSNFYKILTTDKAATHLILKNITDHAKQLNNIGVTNTKGEPIVVSFILTPEQEKITLFDRPYFQTVLRTKEKTISPVVMGRFSNKRIVNLASPIVVDGEIKAVINTSFDMDYEQKEIEQLLLSDKKSSVFIFDNEGQLNCCLTKQIVDGSDKDFFNNSPIMKEIKTGKTGIIENQKIPWLDKSVIGAGTLINDSDWIIISVQPTEVVFAPIFKVQSVVWLIVLSALLFSLSVVTYLLRKVKIIF